MVDKHAWLKWLLLAVLTVLSLWCVIPADKIRLGLDLRGGTSLTVRIDEARLRQDIKLQAPQWSDAQIESEIKRRMDGALDRVVEVLRNRVDNLGIAEPEIRALGQNRVQVQLPGVDEEKRKQAEESVRRAAFLEFRLVHERNAELVAKLFANNDVPEGYLSARVGNQQVYVEDPNFPRGKRDPEYRDRLGRWHVPGIEFEFLMEKMEHQNEIGYRPLFVERKRQLAGDLLKDAAVDYRTMGQPVVDLTFDSRGAKIFGQVTEDYGPYGPLNKNSGEGRQLAIVLDGTCYSAPVIKEAIYGGKAQISGSFSVQEAQLLANVLRAGSLPVPVTIEDMRYVSPTLGKDSIQSGVRSACLGGSLVILMMCVYYLINGTIASAALILNIVLLPLGMILTAGIMSLFVPDIAAGGGKVQLPVITLPGIAGIALTFGMSVDANVLILERMREEMKTGKRFWGVVTAGYDRAFLAISDTNLTILLTGALMFIFGAGPVRGYAVTLCAGVIVSMYTALTFTKMVYALRGEAGTLGMLKMLKIIPETSIDFVKWRVPAIAVSLAVIVGGWGTLAWKYNQNPAHVLGVDFLGGSVVSFTYRDVPADTLPQVSDVRAAIEAGGVSDADIQYQSAVESGGRDLLVVRTGKNAIGDVKPADLVSKALTAKFPDAGFSVHQEEAVGPQIGRELKKKAMMALGIALAGMIVFLWWRFEISFGVAATVALFHDVLITAAVYSVLGRDFNLPTVTALLTIAGYSANDTIVIFDRIRENLKTDKQRSFVELCNLSMNQTLSRTLLTSMMTFVTVVMLLVFGGGALHDFALTMFIGMIAGTYSTMFIATPIVLWWHKGRRPELHAVKARA